MKRIAILIAFVLLVGQASWASHTAIIGGFRSGLALGIETVKDLNDRVSGRFGMEATTGEDLSFTGDNPFIMFLEGKIHLFDFVRSPMSLGLGLVGIYGVQTEYGGTLSLIFDRIYDRDELFLEAGIDYVSRGRLMLQVGYKLY